MELNKITYQDAEITKFLIESKKHGIFEILVDTENWSRIKKYKWHINLESSKIFYVKTLYKKRIVRLHRFILKVEDNNKLVDHINHDTLDNRKNNLRICNQSENLRNTNVRKNNKSGYKGVCWNKARSKWFSQIMVNGELIYLGLYNNIIDAVKIHNEAAMKYHKEYARFNSVI